MSGNSGGSRGEAGGGGAGGGRGGAPPLFLAQTAFFGDCPPLSQGLDDPPPPPSEGLDLPLGNTSAFAAYH